jgi:hypothetical protein
VRYRGRYYAVYHANDHPEWKGPWTTCLAVSDDLVRWEKYAGNPVIRSDDSSGILVDDGGRLRLYTMHPQLKLWLPRGTESPRPAPAPVPAPGAAVRPERTVALFDGRDLRAFDTWLVDSRHEDPLRVFSVVDQVDGAPALRISGERWGGILTREAYRDYRLVVEFRWGLATWGERRRAARDSGVLVHAQGLPGNTGRDGNGPWMRSIEAQVIEGGVGDFILVAGYEPDGRRLVPSLVATAGTDRDGEPVFDPSAAPRAFADGRINWLGRDVDWKDVLGFRGRQDVESPLGEWTRLEVVAEGDRITNVVNGTVVNRATGASLREGRIMIQSEGAEIYVRRVELHPLGPTP